MWKLKILYYGKMDVPVEYLYEGLSGPVETPYCGFLLSDGRDNILVDTGVSEDYFIDGKAFGGFPAEGGSSFVSEALDREGLKPGDIGMVLYTHLHNDHAGNCDLFPEAVHVFQQDEWTNLVDPLPSQLIRRDYDLDVIEKLEKLETYRISGDMEILKGISLYKTPGHTLGHQIISIETEKGRKVLIGDLCNDYLHFFPAMDTFTDMYGNTTRVKRNPLYADGIAEPSSIIYDHYSWYASIHKAKALTGNRIEQVIPGHEWSLLVGTF